MRSAAVQGFLPSRHGFAFANRWPSGPAFEWRAGYLRIGIGDVADGLCGGMCHAAADRFLRGEATAAEAPQPMAGAPLFREIARRQLDSFHWLVGVPFRFWWASTRLRAGRWTAADQAREWRVIRADIDAGRPAMLGLVRAATGSPFSLNANHQVLGYAYEAAPSTATIRIYDPNHPRRDDVELRLRVRGAAADGSPGGSRDTTTEHGPPAATPDPAAAGRRAISLEQSTGEPLLALLRWPYRPVPRPG
ncbi:MAG TPA: hypothetical protein VFX65_09715 [Candidatus Limnocylindrales bacterium]|nr:hypothetical protein [Candidatus Limnocylindrales bacterium]